VNDFVTRAEVAAMIARATGATLDAPEAEPREPCCGHFQCAIASGRGYYCSEACYEKHECERCGHLHPAHQAAKREQPLTAPAQGLARFFWFPSGMKLNARGSWCEYPAAEAIVAAKDAEIAELRDSRANACVAWASGVKEARAAGRREAFGETADWLELTAREHDRNTETLDSRSPGGIAASARIVDRRATAKWCREKAKTV
jgi:hypothetical protein